MGEGGLILVFFVRICGCCVCIVDMVEVKILHGTSTIIVGVCRTRGGG